MEIVDWPTSYDHYACDMTKEQKECLDFVCKSIDEGNYVDVGDNDNYLFVYNKRLQSRLFYTEKKDSEFCNKKENRLFCHHNTYLSKDYRIVLDKYYEYICAYKKTNPYSIRYAYRTYIFVEFYVKLIRPRGKDNERMEMDSQRAFCGAFDGTAAFCYRICG